MQQFVALGNQNHEGLITLITTFTPQFIVSNMSDKNHNDYN